MLEFFKGFFSNQAIFERVVRSIALAGAAATAGGAIPINPKYAWIPAVVGGMIAAGDKNSTPPTK